MYELGRSKRASQAYAFDDVAIAPASNFPDVGVKS